MSGNGYKFYVDVFPTIQNQDNAWRLSKEFLEFKADFPFKAPIIRQDQLAVTVELIATFFIQKKPVTTYSIKRQINVKKGDLAIVANV